MWLRVPVHRVLFRLKVSTLRNLKPATHLAILFADRGEFDRGDRHITSPISGMSNTNDFIRRSAKIARCVAGLRQFAKGLFQSSSRANIALVPGGYKRDV